MGNQEVTGTVAESGTEAARKKGEATNDAVAPAGGRPRQAVDSSP